MKAFILCRSGFRREGVCEHRSKWVSTIVMDDRGIAFLMAFIFSREMFS